MATLTFTPTRNKNIEPDSNGRHQVYFGTLAASASADTYATGGAVCSFSAISGVPHLEAPVCVYLWSETPANGFVFTFVTGTTIANGKVVISTTNTVALGTAAPFVEMTNGTACGAVIFGDTKLRFEARFVHGK
jgi:outer membrane protein assembly factor BamB